MMSVRVRFAPSPTGYLHIGGVRTALYSWLWARKHGGEFVLRIEDTDAARSTQEAVDVILESMRWLGLDWDEGPEVGGPHAPYFQTEREALYAEWAEKLIASGHAYRCWATKEEIQAQREAYEQGRGGKKGFKFRSPWRDRTDGDPSQPHVVRFKAPREGKTGWTDLVYGDVAYPNKEQQDFVLIRENGLPLYNFGCFVDDLTMGITLVTRGDDHLVNTPMQLMLYDAVGAERPQFAHLPMVLDASGKKLSKRSPGVGVAVLDYRDGGYLPAGVLNYLARLGWSHGDEELFTLEELIAKFDWKGVGKTGSRWDKKKLAHVQGHHLRSQDDATLAKLVTPFLAERGVEVAADDARLVNAIAPVKLRATTLIDLAEGLDYLFRPDAEIAPENDKAAKHLKPATAPYLEKVLEVVRATEPFTAEALAGPIESWVEAEELKMGKVAQPVRVAITGRTRSPGLFETLELVGKEASIARLEQALERARAAE
ncbi:MAG: glutamate--tRNA ligase [Sandaracinus sp.]|nr:glutamate--tRNA ligase [Sandaracinus sp.]MBJ71981.1 glutamate--tRNA ligase [Sandaracinus sp.]